jgi:hypothetical protein
MWRAVCLTVAFVVLAGCDYKLTGLDRCSDGGPTGHLELVVRPAPGFAGHGALVFVGDTLPLVAEVRRLLSWSTDVWGGGGCTPSYGDPEPATIEWWSAQGAIATVTATGVVRPVSEGTVRISARAKEQSLVGGLDVVVWVRAGG